MYFWIHWNSESKQLYFNLSSNEIKSAAELMVRQSAFCKYHSLNLYVSEIFYIGSQL